MVPDLWYRWVVPHSRRPFRWAIKFQLAHTRWRFGAFGLLMPPLCRQRKLLGRAFRVRRSLVTSSHPWSLTILRATKHNHWWLGGKMSSYRRSVGRMRSCWSFGGCGEGIVDRGRRMGGLARRRVRVDALLFGNPCLRTRKWQLFSFGFTSAFALISSFFQRQQMLFPALQVEIGPSPLRNCLPLLLPIRKCLVAKKGIRRFPGASFDGVASPLHQVHSTMVELALRENRLDLILRQLLTGGGGGDRDVIILPEHLPAGCLSAGVSACCECPVSTSSRLLFRAILRLGLAAHVTAALGPIGRRQGGRSTTSAGGRQRQLLKNNLVDLPCVYRGLSLRLCCVSLPLNAGLG